MQGIYVQSEVGGNYHRPKSKKQIKELIAAGELHRVYAEATSMFGNEYNGGLDQAPAGTITFVGPDPYYKRNFYGNITVRPDGSVIVK